MERLSKLIRSATVAAAITLALCCLGVPGYADPPTVTLPYTEIKGDPQAPRTTAVALSGDGHLLAVGYVTGRVRLYDVLNKQWLRWLDVKHHNAVASLAVSPDGSLAASCDNGETVILSSCVTGKVIKDTGATGEGVASIAFTADGRELAGGSGNVYFWSVPDMAVSHTIEIPHGAAYIAVANGRLAVENDQCGVWDIATGTKLSSHELTESSGPVALSPDGKFVLSASGLWDVDKNKSLGDMRVQAGSFGFSATGDYAVGGGSEEDPIYFLDGRTGAILAGIDFSGNLTALSRDGKLLAVVGSESDTTLIQVDFAKIQAAAYHAAHPSTREVASKALIDAIQKRNAEAADTALHNGADPNTKAEWGPAALTLCASTNRLDIFKALIKAGARFDPKDQVRMNELLNWSTTAPSPEILKYLLSHGGQITHSNGPNLLSSAVSFSSENTVAVLLDHHVAVDSVPTEPVYNGRTPLMSAAESGKPKTIALLLRRGANQRRLSSKEHQSAYQYALVKGDAACVRLLLNGAPNYNPKFASGMTAGIYGVRLYDPELLEAMIRHGVDINARDTTYVNGTPLNYAVDFGSEGVINKRTAECVRVLLAHGAKVNAKDSRGLTPLDVCRDPESKKILLKYGAIAAGGR